ncbi:hypothetical protein GCM10009820_05880 [Leifsonia soli]
MPAPPDGARRVSVTTITTTTTMISNGTSSHTIHHAPAPPIIHPYMTASSADFFNQVGAESRTASGHKVPY